MTINIGYGYTIKGAELLAAFKSIQTWKVTGGGYQNGYGGYNHGGDVEIDWKAIGGWQSTGDSGLDFLVLHEVAHNTQVGVMTRSWQVNTYRSKNPGDPTLNGYGGQNPQFIKQEQYTNSIARKLAAAAGIALPSQANYPDFPKYGYAGDFHE